LVSPNWPGRALPVLLVCFRVRRRLGKNVLCFVSYDYLGMIPLYPFAVSVVYPLNPDVGDKGVRGQFTAVFCGTDGCHLWNGPVRGAGGRINGRRAVFSSKFAGAVCP
jgi:hypothetical protein